MERLQRTKLRIDCNAMADCSLCRSSCSTANAIDQSIDRPAAHRRARPQSLSCRDNNIRCHETGGIFLSRIDIGYWCEHAHRSTRPGRDLPWPSRPSGWAVHAMTYARTSFADSGLRSTTRFTATPAAPRGACRRSQRWAGADPPRRALDALSRTSYEAESG